MNFRAKNNYFGASSAADAAGSGGHAGAGLLSTNWGYAIRFARVIFVTVCALQIRQAEQRVPCAGAGVVEEGGRGGGGGCHSAAMRAEKAQRVTAIAQKGFLFADDTLASKDWRSA
jgi:hypothetical protein